MRTLLRSVLRPAPWLCVLACGPEPEIEQQPSAEYGCLHIAEGTLVDVSAERSTASVIVVGREPYRINMLPDVPGFVAVESPAGGDVVVLADFPDTLTALWRGDDREEVAAGEPNPYCEEDIPALYEISLAAGTNHLELGPVFQGNVWLMIAAP